MNSPQKPSDDAGKPRTHRPSLGGSGASSTTAANASILQTLEGQGQPGHATAGPVTRSKLPLLAGLSVAAALAAWLVLRPTPMASPASPDLRVADAKAPVPKTAVPNPAAPAEAAAASASPSAATAGADPAAPGQAVARLEQLPDSAAPTAAAPTPPAVASAAAATAATPASPSAPRPQASASSKPRRAATQPTASTSKAAVAKPSPAATASTRAAPPPAGDRDVELMAALMSHVGMPTDSAGRALPRNEQATIAGLVANCRTKPRAEADQCRREICGGYWGKAEACPARGKPAAKPAAKSVGKAAPAPAYTPVT